MADRTIDDMLRGEYFDLLPEAERIANVLETNVRFRLLPIINELKVYEKIVVHSRVKTCESAINALRRREESRMFDVTRQENYTLTKLKDLVGVRVLAFPGQKVEAVVGELANLYPDWESDPVKDGDMIVSPKFNGYCSRDDRISAEYQVTPMLIGLFWEVEHAAIYKSSPELKGAVASLDMQVSVREVYKAVATFESKFQRIVDSSS